MALTRIKSDNILDKEVKAQDLADGAVTFDKINITGGVAAGEVLKTDGAGGLFWELATGSSASLDTLSDVDVTTSPPLIGDALAWDGAFWAPQSSIAGNPQNLTLTNLVDVTLTAPFIQNSFLRFDGFGWVNDKVSVIYVDGIAPVAITGLINDLANVNVVGATVDQRLAFDGSQWRAVNAAEFGAINQLTDVDTTGVVNNDALVFNSGTGQWNPAAISGLGNETFVVADIIARDALVGVATGDQAFVRSGVTTGEWEMYLWDAAWILISTMDSAATDARTIAGDIDITTVSPVLLGNVSAGARVTLVSIDVSIAFDFTIGNESVLTVGTDGSPTTNTELASDNELDLGVVGTYTIVTDVEYLNAADTDIKAYFAVGDATAGAARILVTYV